MVRWESSGESGRTVRPGTAGQLSRQATRVHVTATPSSRDIRGRIRKAIAGALPQLTPSLRAWAEAHLIPPRPITLYVDFGGSTTEEFWLATDATGKADGSYRVIYTEDLDCFGLSVILSGGRDYCMGFYGGFAETIQNM